MNIQTKYSPGESVWFVEHNVIDGRNPRKGRVLRVKATTTLATPENETEIEYIVNIGGRHINHLVTESEAYGSPEALEAANPGMSCKGCEKGGEA